MPANNELITHNTSISTEQPLLSTVNTKTQPHSFNMHTFKYLPLYVSAVTAAAVSTRSTSSSSSTSSTKSSSIRTSSTWSSVTSSTRSTNYIATTTAKTSAAGGDDNSVDEEGNKSNMTTTTKTTTANSSTKVSTTPSYTSSPAVVYTSSYVSPTTAPAQPTTTAAATTASMIPSGNGPCANGAAPARTYTAANGDVYGICLNTDFPGGDLGVNPNGIASPEACAAACSTTPGCVAGNLLRDAQICYLKGTQQPASSNPGVDAVYKISSGAAPATSSTMSTTASASPAQTTTAVATTPSTTAPASSSMTTTAAATTSAGTSAAATTTSAAGTGPCANGAGPDRTYTVSNGDVYGVCLNTDFPGGDNGRTASVTTPEACADACSADSNCVAGNIVRGGSICYLKSTLTPALVNNGVDGVYKISSGTRSSTSATTTATTTSAVYMTTTTQATTSDAAASTTTPVSSSTLTTTSSASATSPAGTGPCANGAPVSSTYTTSDGSVYGICLNTDFPGGDLQTGSPVTGVADGKACASACSKVAGCVAGSLVRDAQVCYLKGSLTPASPNSSVDSVFKISGGSAPAATTTMSTSAMTSSTPSPTSSNGVCACTNTVTVTVTATPTPAP